MLKTSQLISLLAFTSLMQACQAPSEITPPQTSSAKILFYSNRDQQKNQIYSLNLDGSDLKPLSPTGTASYNPVWSPTSDSVLFSSFTDKQYDIWVGSQLNQTQNISQNKAQDDFPQWSPDGEQIAFHSNRGGIEQIYLASAQGGQATRLSPAQLRSRYPQWSPDGQQLVFLADRPGGGQDIWRVQADGSQATNLTAQKNQAFYPRWSPDGQQLLYLAQENSRWNLWVMKTDGTNAKRLSDHAEVITPAWSPDGKQIAYISKGDYAEGAPDGSAPLEDSNNQLMLIHADGSSAQQLSEGIGDLNPHWSPDGQFILFQSQRDGNSEIYR